MLRIRPKFRRACEEISDNKDFYLKLATAIVFVYLLVTKVFVKGVVFPIETSDTYIGSARDKPFYEGCVDTLSYLKDPSYKKMNATFVMLTKNDEIDGVLHSVNSLESHFNQWFHYPYVFLNDVPFSEEFKKEIKNAVSGDVHFDIVDKYMWQIPEERTDPEAFKNAIDTQGDRGFLYGGSASYHRMCRFYSGSFYKHPLVRRHEWYWRIEPEIDFYCDITYDPFFEMAKHNKKYGFNIMIEEIYATVPNLFRYTMAFIKKYRIKPKTLWKLFSMNHNILKTSNQELQSWVNFYRDVEPKLAEKIVIEDFLRGENPEDSVGLGFLIRRSKAATPIVEDQFDNEEYNLYHFWSNFEIARVDTFDNPIYNAYFEYLDRVGGFWRERWGDAPVHSLGLGLMLDVEDIHYFRDIGYQHSIMAHCPKNAPNKQLVYKEADSRRKRGFFKNRYDSTFENGCGCRCKCPRQRDTEDKSWECMHRWKNLLQPEDEELNGGLHEGYVDVKREEDKLRKLFQI
ncbi:alpha-1,2-mannosyltransferase [Zygosaccharomyces mellis]|uniref:Alpha-1,2-mannosyltransferase n=1 Tax=Zygosaccharomyces mellis TaxID=42258 RepID=A0A4C2E2M1_9SACH|nr:alpha-1,2-mannosyltransferase [Zygosaccharomyces mellis]